MKAELSALPSRNRLSSLFAIIITCFLLVGFIQLPPLHYETTITGIYFNVQFDFSQLAAFLCSVVVLLGSYSIMQDHPHTPSPKCWQHSWLPALAAFTIADLLLFFPSYQWLWWIVLFFGSLTLFFMVLCEYATLGSEGQSQLSLANLWLKCSGSAALLMITVYWHSNTNRLFLLLPLLILCFSAYTHRMLSLQGSQESSLGYTLSAVVAAIYISTSLYYWQLSSFSYSLMSVSFLLIFITLISQIKEGSLATQAVIRAIITLSACWMIAIWLF